MITMMMIYFVWCTKTVVGSLVRPVASPAFSWLRVVWRTAALLMEQRNFTVYTDCIASVLREQQSFIHDRSTRVQWVRNLDDCCYISLYTDNENKLDCVVYRSLHVFSLEIWTSLFTANGRRTKRKKNIEVGAEARTCKQSRAMGHVLRRLFAKLWIGLLITGWANKKLRYR